MDKDLINDLTPAFKSSDLISHESGQIQNLADRNYWLPILSQLVPQQDRLTYQGDLKTALLEHSGLSHHPKGEQIYQLATEISRLTTCCDPEVIYWFSRLAALLAKTP